MIINYTKKFLKIQNIFLKFHFPPFYSKIVDYDLFFFFNFLLMGRWNIQMPSIVKGSISILSDAGLGMAMFSLGIILHPIVALFIQSLLHTRWQVNIHKFIGIYTQKEPL